MILIDLNLLVYAVDADTPLHGKAKAWVEAVMSGREAVGLPPIKSLAPLKVLL